MLSSPWLDRAARTKVFIDHLDALLLKKPTLDTPEALELMETLAGQVAIFHRTLKALGIKKAKPPKGAKLAEFMKSLQSQDPPAHA